MPTKTGHITIWTPEECPQGTKEWLDIRSAIPTASCFDKVCAKDSGRAEISTRQKYVYQIACEKITGEFAGDDYSNAAMERGKKLEDDARNIYAAIRDDEITRIGFVRSDAVRGDMGASPDSFLDKNGGLEIKTKMGHLIVDAILKNEPPAAHKKQVQGSLYVCEREWWDLAIYWPKMPLVIHRIYRDEPYILGLKSEIIRFNDEVAETVERIKRYEPRA